MLGVLKIDKGSSLKPQNPDPVELRFVPGVIVFFRAGVNAPSATDTPGKLKAVTPDGVGHCFLCADLEFLPVFPRVPLFQLGNDAFLLFRGHFAKMFLKEVFGLFL